MPYEVLLALRYLYSTQRGWHARVTTLAALAGIACGVAALIVALALGNGFRDELQDKILRGTAHVTLLRRSGEAIDNWPGVVERVRATGGVRDAAPTTYDGALLSGATNSAYAVLRAVDASSTRAVETIRGALIAGSVAPLLKNANKEANALPEVLIGAELAARTGLRIGDTAQLIAGDTAASRMSFTGATSSLLDFAPRVLRVRVAGVFRFGLYEYDATWVYLALEEANAFANLPPTSASVISIEMTDIYDAPRVAARVRESLGVSDYTTIDWQTANRPLFAALALERRMGSVVIALIVFVAALNITTTLVLVVTERRADIAVLRAMGAHAGSIMLLFITEGACIGLLGALLGAMLGLAACAVGERYHLVSLPGDVYSLSNVPFHARAEDVWLAALVAFVLSLLATIYPARAAARLRPAEALRDA